MKAFAVIFTILFCAHVVSGQTKTVTISERRIANSGATLLCSYNKTIDTVTNNSSLYILILFRDLQLVDNEEYRSLRFSVPAEKATVLQFVRDLKEAYTKIDNKSDLAWVRDSYKINLQKANNLLFIEENNKGGYTALNKANVEKLIVWLGEIGFKI